jgi:hypothetical protein
MQELNALLQPGMLVRHPERPDWGIGQVQSNAGGHVTVNFQETGKQVLNAATVFLEPVTDHEP